MHNFVVRSNEIPYKIFSHIFVKHPHLFAYDTLCLSTFVYLLVCYVFRNIMIHFLWYMRQVFMKFLVETHISGWSRRVYLHLRVKSIYSCKLHSWNHLKHIFFCIVVKTIYNLSYLAWFTNTTINNYIIGLWQHGK